MSRTEQRVGIIREEYKEVVTELLKRQDRLIRERNRLEIQLIKANDTISEYQAWFKKHEHLTPAIHTPIMELRESVV